MYAGSPRRDALRLDRVVLRGAEDARPDPLCARLRLERTLAATDWTQTGLPPGALLFVRRLRVHGPGFDVPDRASAGGCDPFADDRAFASHVADALRAQGRVARRPWSDDAAADADAVWFEDEDELAACLVRDWLRGRVAQRWWWRSVLGGDGIDTWLRRELLARGERLAPTLHRLAAASSAVAWLSRMDDADARAGLASLIRAYALPHLRVDGGDAMQPAGPGSSDADRDPVSGRSTPASTPSLARRRLQRIVPELRAVAWHPAQARLLACGLALLRAPTEARTRRFAEDLDAWRAATDAGDMDTRAGVVTAVVDPPTRGVRRDRSDALPHVSSRVRTQVGGRLRHATMADLAPGLASATLRDALGEAPDASPLNTTLAGANEHVQASRDVDARPATSPCGTSPMPDGDPVPLAVEALAPETVVTPVIAQPRDVEPAASDAMPVVRARTIVTSHGGLFYLLNAALTLGLYGDFTAPRAQGLSLSPWDLLAWLGQHWFGRAFRRDPLWRLLADLAGRAPKRAPSWRVDPPSQWAPGDDWLRPWAPMAMLEHGVDRRARRLQVRHPAGFAVFDVPRETRLRPAAQARALCLSRETAMRARLRPSPSMSSPALPVDPGLRWLHRFAHYMAARLMRALGTASPREAVALLCRHAAEVRCDASRVEIALSLAHLPLPVRIAGLDRDPGWIPAAGRDVRFHFS